MAKRVLEVQVIGDAASLKRALGSAGASTDKFGREADTARGKFTVMGEGVRNSAKIAGAALGGALALGAKKAFDEFAEAEKVGGQTKAVIKSTGGAANITAKQVENLANALSLKSGKDDELIQKGANVLLTFKGVRNEVGKGNKIFDEATRLTLDMSVALGTDMNKSAIQVGKALNDPIKGITALSRVGVTFTDQQKEQIKALVESGDKMGAQKIILAELKTEFEGSAAAQATGADKLKVAFENVMETIGEAFGPVVMKASEALADLFNDMRSGEGVGGKIVDVFKGIKKVFDGLPTPIKAVGIAVAALGALFLANPIIAAVAAIAAGAVLIIKNWDRVKGFFSDVGRAIMKALGLSKDDVKALGDAVHNVGEGIKWAFEKVAKPVLEKVFLPVAKEVFGAVADTMRGFVKIVGGIVKVISGIFTGDFGKMWDGVKQIFEGGAKVIWSALKAVTAPIRKLGSMIIDGLVAGLKGLGKILLAPFKAAWNAITDFFGISSPSKLFKTLGKELIRGLIAGIKGLIDGVEDAFEFVFEGAKKIVKGVGKFVIGIIKDTFGALAGVVRGVAGAVKDAVNFVVGPIEDAFNAAGDALDDAFGKNATKTVSEVVSGLTSKVSNLAGGLRGVADGARGGKSGLSDVTDAAIFMAENLPGASSAVDDLGLSILGLPPDRFPKVVAEVTGFQAVQDIGNAILGVNNKNVGVNVSSTGLQGVQDIGTAIAGVQPKNVGVNVSSTGLSTVQSIGDALLRVTDRSSNVRVVSQDGAQTTAEKIGNAINDITDRSAGVRVISKDGAQTTAEKIGNALLNVKDRTSTIKLKVSLGKGLTFVGNAIAPKLAKKKVRRRSLGRASIATDYDSTDDYEDYASGALSTPGGLAMVGERGPELVNLPQGSRVFNTNETSRVLGSQAGMVYLENHNHGSDLDEAAVASRLAWLIQAG